MASSSSSKLSVSVPITWPEGDGNLHKLSRSWCLWAWKKPSKYKKSNAGNEYAAELVNIKQDIESWEQLIGILSHVRSIDDLVKRQHVDCDIMLFKSGCRPLWEEYGGRGGMWYIIIQLHDQPYRKHGADGCADRSIAASIWARLLAFLVHGAYQPQCGDIVQGGFLTVRQHHPGRIALWVSDDSRHDVLPQLGATLRRALDLPREVKLRFMTFSDWTQHGYSGQAKYSA